MRLSQPRCSAGPDRIAPTHSQNTELEKKRGIVTVGEEADNQGSFMEETLKG